MDHKATKSAAHHVGGKSIAWWKEAHRLQLALCDDLEAIAGRAYDQLSRLLGVSLAPIVVELHETLEGFRRTTSKPWWVSTVSSGTRIDLTAAALLAQREGIERAVRTAMSKEFGWRP